MAIRVLHVITGMGSGGAESMIMNWYRNIDRESIQFDFLLRSPENIYADEIQSLGGRVCYTAEYPKSYFKNKKQTIEFFKEHASEYAAIHVHNNALLYVNVFDIAKKYGIKNKIIHSHSIKTKNKVFEILHRINKMQIEKKATAFLACSQAAGEWMFPSKVKFQVIPNGIDTEKFQYDTSFRQTSRQELNIGNYFVLGHVGRFLDVKNHAFLLDVFEQVCKKNENVALILVGTGPLEAQIKDEVKRRGLEDKVHFLGVRKDVNKIYSAMDVFLLPSKYEGLGVVLVEAQANGLYCFASDRVPAESKATEKIFFLPINNPMEWAEKIASVKVSEQRTDAWKMVAEGGFDIKNSVEELKKYYLIGRR